MTLDPVIEVKPLWGTLFRRNKVLLHKFALINSTFVPRKPVKFCLECLTMIAGERNVAWYIMAQQPDILYAGVPLPWPSPEGPDPEGNTKEANLSSNSGPSTSTELDRLPISTAEHEPVGVLLEVEFNDANRTSRRLHTWTGHSISRLSLAPENLKFGVTRHLISSRKALVQHFNCLFVRSIRLIFSQHKSASLQILQGGLRSTSLPY
jgi:hypothetical protein